MSEGDGAPHRSAAVGPEVGLPAVLPLFPLTGSLLLPGAELPLHVFEARYRNLVEDALAGEPYLGMIQPLEPDPEDNHPSPDAAPGHPALYPVGGAGRIERWQRLAGGRYLILLRGVARFRVRRELALHRGYRRAEAEYAGLPAEASPGDGGPARGRLMDALRAFAAAHRLEVDAAKLRPLTVPALVDRLAMALPFSPAEKQALLEAEGWGERLEVLLPLLTMGARSAAWRPPSAPWGPH